MRALILVAALGLVSVAAALPSDATLSRRIVGTWHGDRHDIRYFSDGTYRKDPAYTPPTKRDGRWHIEHARLIEASPVDDYEFGTTSTYEIVRLDHRLLRIRWIMPDSSRRPVYSLTRVLD
jgi:hypothetical protein